jgi:protein gp37
VGDKSAIEWTDATWNPIRRTWRPDRPSGHDCLKLSPGCDNCWAGKLQPRYYSGLDYQRIGTTSLQGMHDAVAAGDLYLDPDVLRQPLLWKRPRRIFVCSMTDLFGEWVPDAWLDAIWGTMALAPQHTFQVLTKRPNRMADYLSDPIRIQFAWVDRLAQQMQRSIDMRTRWPLPNAWLGVSIESDAFAWRAKVLAEIPAAIRFVSAEPLLGPLHKLSFRWVRCYNQTAAGACGWVGPLHEIYDPGHGYTERCPRCHWGLELLQEAEPRLHWVIVGGESGGPAHRALVERCHCTQLGPAGSLFRQACDRCGGSGIAPKGAAYAWVQGIQIHAQAQGTAFLFKQWGGRTPKQGGRLLNGQTWDEYPTRWEPAHA